jgi:hypothetical protein
MNVGIVGVPMVDSDPVELRTEIGLHLPGEIEGKRLEIGHLAGILWRDDEPEMMPVTLAAVGKGSIIGAVARGVEHDALLAVTDDALPLEIGEVSGKRRGPEGAALMAHACFDHDAPGRTEKPAAAKCAVSTAKAGAGGPNEVPRAGRYGTAGAAFSTCATKLLGLEPR